MPTSVKVSVGVLAALAALLLLSSLLTALAWGAVVDAVADGQDTSRASASQIVAINLAQSLVFGVLAAVSAVFLARGRSWARWTGLATGLLLGLVTLGAILLAGGIAVTSQLVIVLCAAAVVSLLSRTTAAWASPGPRSPRAG
jgi:predicted lipid-binding transport protein (Tim44 family)